MNTYLCKNFVGVVRIELTQAKATCFTDKPNSPTLAHSHIFVVLTGIEPASQD